MLRSDAVVAVEEVMLACRRAAKGYADAAAIIDDCALNALFSNLADQRERMATELKSHIRSMGEAPSEPDPDRNLVAKAIRHIKSALTTDEELALLCDREQDEDTIIHHITAALSKDMPESTRKLLLRCQDQVSAAREQLARARIGAIRRKGE